MVKVIHVVKYLDSVKRDVAELTEIASFLDSKRCYYDSVKIAIEQEINALLNEKNKVVDMAFQEVDQKLQTSILPTLEDQKEISESTFSLEVFEKEFISREPIKRNVIKMAKDDEYFKESSIVKKVVHDKKYNSFTNLSENNQIKKSKSTQLLEEEVFKFPAQLNKLNKRGQKTLDSIRELTNLNLSRSEILDRLPQVD